MPAWVADHDLWEKAKKKAKESGASESDGDKFWGTVTKIYKNMGGKVKKSMEKSILNKGKNYPIGYISQRKDGAYKKVAKDTWVPISQKEQAKKTAAYHKAKLNVTHAIADIYEDLDFKLSLGKFDDDKKQKKAAEKLHLYLGETIHGILTRSDITRDTLANAFVDAGYDAKYADSMIRGVKPMKKSVALTLIKAKKYPIGYVSQRKDGAYKKVAESKWTPVKGGGSKQSAGKTKPQSQSNSEEIDARKLKFPKSVQNVYEKVDSALMPGFAGKMTPRHRHYKAYNRLLSALKEVKHGDGKTKFTLEQMRKMFEDAGWSPKKADAMFRGVTKGEFKPKEFKKVNVSKELKEQMNKKGAFGLPGPNNVSKAFYYPNHNALLMVNARNQSITVAKAKRTKDGKFKISNNGKDFRRGSLSEPEEYIKREMSKSYSLLRKAVEGVKIDVTGQELIDGLTHRIIHHRTKLEHLEHPTTKITPENAGELVEVDSNMKEHHKRKIEEYQALKNRIKPKETYILTPYEYSDYVSEFYDG